MKTYVVGCFSLLVEVHKGTSHSRCNAGAAEHLVVTVHLSSMHMACSVSDVNEGYCFFFSLHRLSLFPATLATRCPWGAERVDGVSFAVRLRAE